MARAMLATCPALLLQFAPGSGVNLLTAVLSERPFVESDVDSVCATSEASRLPAFPAAAPTLEYMDCWSRSNSSLTAWIAVRYRGPSRPNPAYSGRGVTAM